MGQIKKDSRRFSVSCCVVKPPFCILSSSSSRTRLEIPPRRSPRSWTQMKVKPRPSLSVNLYPSTKMIVSVIKNVQFGPFLTGILTFQWVKVSISFNFMFFHDPRRSELIRPGLAVRVDPVRPLHLPEDFEFRGSSLEVRVSRDCQLTFVRYCTSSATCSTRRQ